MAAFPTLVFAGFALSQFLPWPVRPRGTPDRSRTKCGQRSAWLVRCRSGSTRTLRGGSARGGGRRGSWWAWREICGMREVYHWVFCLYSKPRSACEVCTARSNASFWSTVPDRMRVTKRDIVSSTIKYLHKRGLCAPTSQGCIRSVTLKIRGAPVRSQCWMVSEIWRLCLVVRTGPKYCTIPEAVKREQSAARCF